MINCRNCSNEQLSVVLDMGSAPLANRFLDVNDLSLPETWYPLQLALCEGCSLLQSAIFPSTGQIFPPEYAYLSSMSSSWLRSSEQFAMDCVGQFGLTTDSLVIEVAANDGYLLQYFQNIGIPCLGIEPTISTAGAAQALGLDIELDFLTLQSAQRIVSVRGPADLVIAKNVLAHVPDISDFVQGLKHLCKPQGVVCVEFQSLMSMIQNSQFDTVYHEHHSYLSCSIVHAIFSREGLQIWKVEEIPSHGGSLRIYATPGNDASPAVQPSVSALLDAEALTGVGSQAFFSTAQDRLVRIKHDFLGFLLSAQKRGLSVAGYGAAAKACTLTNLTGIRSDLLPIVFDKSPTKVGKYMPGSRIPVVGLDAIQQRKPDFLVIFPWNIREEIMSELSFTRSWGAEFVTVIPELRLW